MLQPSLSSDLNKKSPKVSNDMFLTSASPKSPVADSTQARPKADIPKKKPAGRPFKPSPNVTAQVSTANGHAKKTTVDNEKARNQRKTKSKPATGDSTIEYREGQSLDLPITKFNKQAHAAPILPKSAEANVAKKAISTDITPELAVSSMSAEGESISTPKSLVTLPTTTLPTEGANTPDAIGPRALKDTDQKERNVHLTSSYPHLDSGRLRSKLEAADVRTQVASQSMEPAPEEDVNLTRMDRSKVSHESDGKTDHREDQNSPGESGDRPPPDPQKTLESRSTSSNLPQADDSNQKSGGGDTKALENDIRQIVQFRAGSMEKQISENVAGNVAGNVGIAAHQSQNRQERKDLPTGSGSAVRSLTPAPIITRKKKQKKQKIIDQTNQEKDDENKLPDIECENKETIEEDVSPNISTTDITTEGDAKGAIEKVL